MLTNQDIDELIIKADMEVDDNIEAALEEFYRPDVERETEILWAGLPESVKKMVKMRAPEAVKRIEKRR